MPTVLALSAPDSSLRADLVQAWTDMLERALADAALSPTERLIAGHALLQMAELTAPAQQLRPRLALLVSETLTAARTPADRQTVVNMAGHLLRAAGYEGLAYAVFEAEAARALHGSYFMPYLAEMAQARGDADAARGWWRRAFETAIGDVTRFQLGVRYVRGLASLGASRQDCADAARDVLRHVQGRSGFFYGRTHDSLRQLAAAADALSALRAVADADHDPISRSRIEAVLRPR
jgi:protein disulfide-isomerase